MQRRVTRHGDTRAKTRRQATPRDIFWDDPKQPPSNAPLRKRTNLHEPPPMSDCYLSASSVQSSSFFTDPLRCDFTTEFERGTKNQFGHSVMVRNFVRIDLGRACCAVCSNLTG